MNHVESHIKISDFWKKNREDVTGEGTFFLQFAAICIAGNSATKKVEAIPPRELCRINNQGLSIVQELLIDVE
jgi:hypothetical protein